MAKLLRRSSARPKPFRLALEALEDRSLLSGWAGSFGPPTTMSPFEAGRGPAFVAPGPAGWREPGRFESPGGLWGRADFADRRPAGYDVFVVSPRSWTAGDGGWDRAPRPQPGDGGPRAPEPPGGVRTPVGGPVAEPTGSTPPVEPPRGGVPTLGPTPAEPGGEPVRVTPGRPFLLLSSVDAAARLAVTNSHLNGLSPESGSLPVVLP